MSNTDAAKVEQFAEMYGSSHHKAQIIAGTVELPEFCYSVNHSTRELILIKKHVSGYYPTEGYSTNEEFPTFQDVADLLNYDKLELSKGQVQAMEIGSMMGWDVPGADPNSYDINGKWGV